jgi:5'-phosphate synthase pdxT subunit
MVKKITIGVLALQGDFLEHLQVFDSLGVATKEIRLPKDLEAIDGIVFPGGESTTMAHLLAVFSLRDPLIRMIQNGIPVWGTCAGMILLAKKLKQDCPVPLGLMDIVVDRNAFGRQVDSFTIALAIPALGKKPLEATFIRAPRIISADSGVRVLSQLAGGEIVAAQQKNMLVTAFHPELTGDTRLHEYFLSMIRIPRT